MAGVFQKQSNNTVKMGKELVSIVVKEDIQKMNKHMKSCLMAIR